MRRLRATLTGPLLVLTLLLAPASALGAANHPFLHASEAIYEDACGVARHGGGLYVSSYYQDKILLPAGQIAPESTGSGPCKLELDAAGDLYVDNWHEDVVKYSSSELLPGHGTVIDAANPTGFWVEQATGDLYVAHRTDIAEYDPSGNLIREIGANPTSEYYGVAVSEFPATAGDIYVPDAATNTVKVFDAAGMLIEEMDGIATPQGHFSYLKDGEIAVDNSATSPSYGHIYVLDAIGHGLSEHPIAVIDEFNAQGDYRGQVTGFTDAEPSGIALDPTSHNLFVTSGNSEGSQVFEYGPTAAAKMLKVVNEGSGSGTVTSSPVGIICGPACAAEFNEGQVLTLFAAADARSTFTGWSVTGSQPCPGTSSCTVSMAANVEVKATFAEPPQETLTVNAGGEGSVTSNPEGIACPGTCSEHFSEGRIVTLTAHPDPHHKLQGWSGCTVQANPEECKVTMSAAAAVSATFTAIPQLPLSVTKAGSGQGTVTSFPSAISCPGASCSAAFDEGSTVYLLAAPAPGSGFAGFSGGGCAGIAPLCAVAMSSAQSVTATFGGGAEGGNAATLALSSVQTIGDSAVLTVKTTEAGTLLGAGAGLTPLKRRLGPGTTTLRVGLGPDARRRLDRHHRLHLRLTMGFAPAGGLEASVRSVRLDFHTAQPRR